MRIEDRFRRAIFGSRAQTVNLDPARVKAGGSMDLSVRRAPNPPDSVDARLNALEENFTELEKDFRRQTERSDAAVTKLSQRIDELRADLEGELARREEERKGFLRASLTLQGIGTFLFVFGAAFSVLGNTVHC